MARLDLAERIRGRTRIAVSRAGSNLESFLRSTGPRDSGDLTRNTYVTPAGPNRLRIEVRVEYASYVREGTRPHTIRPVARRVLAFEWAAAPADAPRLDDGRVIARHVDHPGTRANTWYDDGINRLPDLVLNELASQRI